MRIFNKQLVITCLTLLLLALSACTSAAKQAGESGDESAANVLTFNADSAYSYVKRQVDFGPRVPNTESHAKASEWLASELKRHGATVALQKADLKAFDGTLLHAVNIIGQFNPQASNRTLLLAHYDCRPWADEDVDEARRKLPVDGANDGASGVGVLLEIARQLGLGKTDKGVDILFTDAEDWGANGDDESWALGTRYFAENPFHDGYRPSRAILLDMVGSRDARFYTEYFSQQIAPQLNEQVWLAAEEAGYGHLFPHALGGAITDDHLELQKVGIPAIDIVDFRPNEGFPSTWHTGHDNMDDISAETLKAVGQTILQFLSTLP